MVGVFVFFELDELAGLDGDGDGNGWDFPDGPSFSHVAAVHEEVDGENGAVGIFGQ